jgi:hypothetical protein
MKCVIIRKFLKYMNSAHSRSIAFQEMRFIKPSWTQSQNFILMLKEINSGI